MAITRSKSPSRRNQRVSHSTETQEESDICPDSPLANTITHLTSTFNTVVTWSIFILMFISATYFCLWSTKTLYKIVVHILAPMPVTQGIVLLVGAFSLHLLFESLL